MQAEVAVQLWQLTSQQGNDESPAQKVFVGLVIHVPRGLTLLLQFVQHIRDKTPTEQTHANQPQSCQSQWFLNRVGLGRHFGIENVEYDDACSHHRPDYQFL